MADHDDEPVERTPPDTDIFRALDDRAVLFAYDGSEPSRCAILEAAHRLGPDRCAVVLTVEHGHREEATELAYEGARLARSIGFDAQPAVVSGDPVWRAIADAAEEHHASIVALGRRTGRLATAVARHLKRSVLIVAATSDNRREVRCVPQSSSSTVPLRNPRAGIA